jgi:hypothetical protein
VFDTNYLSRGPTNKIENLEPKFENLKELNTRPSQYKG